MRSRVDLPQPEGPTSTRNSPDDDLEIDAVHHFDACHRTCAHR